MSKLRVSRLSSLLKEEISLIIQRELDVLQVGFITITRVKPSPDLKQAKVYVSLISEENKTNRLKLLKKAVKQIRKSLAQRTELRYIPDLFFYEDNSLLEAQRIDELIERISRKPAGEQDNE